MNIHKTCAITCFAVDLFISILFYGKTCYSHDFLEGLCIYSHDFLEGLCMEVPHNSLNDILEIGVHYLKFFPFKYKLHINCIEVESILVILVYTQKLACLLPLISTLTTTLPPACVF